MKRFQKIELPPNEEDSAGDWKELAFTRN